MLQSAHACYAQDTPEHDLAVTALSDEAFGPGRFVRAAERVREEVPHDRSLSFVATVGRTVAGSVRQTPILIGERPALLLGPLVVKPAFKGLGIGRTLMRMAAEAAEAAGETVILLVGDRAYYMPLGYHPVPSGAVTLPGPVDPQRVLALPLAPGALDGLSGRVRGRRGPVSPAR
ncbi:N-acetyltransferase GCN5 [Aureimonas endophytica]|uniref:N-acetyltransferase GCN5 n=1 Tax=Aureimonas endophytica TaxID=2027858 RepID=A0A916ZYT7_9HYPH|nr:N-acetyltransferase [Aureimonas endophytica]GGE19344.1 N-acetyltransferase GCN5 [Aureimonas endophytica]